MTRRPSPLTAILTLASIGALVATSCGTIDRWRGEGDDDSATSQVPGLGSDGLPPSQAPLALTGSLERYANCDELRADYVNTMIDEYEIRRLETRYRELHRPKASGKAGKAKASASSDGDSDNDQAAPSGAASGSGSGGGDESGAGESSKEVGTNLQEAAVDEADQIKIGPRHVFVVDNQGRGDVQIAVTLKEPLTALGNVVLPDMSAAVLYATEDRLLVAGQGYKDVNGEGRSDGFWIRAYDTAAAAMPMLVGERFLPGTYVDSRFIAGRLVVVVQDRMRLRPKKSFKNMWPSREAIAQDLATEAVDGITADSAGDVACGSFTKGGMASVNLQLTRVLAFDVTTGKVASEVAVPSAGQMQLYMSAEAVVLAGNPLVRRAWIHPQDAAAKQVHEKFQKEQSQLLFLTRIGYDAPTGALTPEASGSVAGALKRFNSQWSFKALEKDGRKLLAVFTTTGSVRQEDDLGPADNHLFVLEAQGKVLGVVGQIPSFAPNEDIRAVRFSGRYAYVVTFKRTDPLFAIDLADPLAPVVAGELKIPGFSLYLHPIPNGRLIGVGYDTEEKLDGGDGAYFQGLQLSLFDAADPENLKRLDNVVIGKRGSYSEVTQDHHAFYFDPSDGVVALPLVAFDDDKPGADGGLSGGNDDDDDDVSGFGSPKKDEFDWVQTPTAATGSGSGAATGSGTAVAEASGSAEKPEVAPVPAPAPAETANQGQNHTKRDYSGAIFYKIDGNKLEEAARVSHYDLLKNRCRRNFAPVFWTNPIPPQADVRRVFRSGDVIYTVSNFAVRTVEAGTYKGLASAPFGFPDCRPIRPQGGFE